MIENHGLKSEVLCVSKLDCVKIIPTAEKRSEKDETARSLSKPITDAQQQVIFFVIISDLLHTRSRIVVTILSISSLMVVQTKPL